MDKKEAQVESGNKVSFKQKRKQDALELAQLVYDMFKESQSDIISDIEYKETHA